MFSLVLHALRARRAQALAMFALATLAALGAAAAPWFLGWGNDTVARSTVALAPATNRLVIGSGSAPFDPAVTSPMSSLQAAVERHLPIAGGELDLGARSFVTMEPENAPQGAPAERESVDIYLLSRTNICDHLRFVTGSCPGEGEVALPRQAATLLGIRTGDTVAVRGFQLQRATLRVSGEYEVADLYETYWASTPLLRELGATEADVSPAVVTEPTLLGLEPDHISFDLHLLLPEDAFLDPAADLRGVLRQGEASLGEAGLSLTVPAYALLNRIGRDRAFLALGVAVGASQLLLLSWVVLFLAVRHTSEERRTDVGLLKLRGATPRRVRSLILLTSGVPMLAGVVVGAVAGFLAAAVLAYEITPELGLFAVARTVSSDPLNLLWQSLAGAVVAGLGGLAAAMVAEWRTLRAPVVDLLRRVPSGRRGWKADLADLVVVVVAAAGVYQGWAGARDGEQASVLALLAPALLALAVALLVARALPPVAAWIGTSALRAGRAGGALAALHLARRPGTQRVFAVLAVTAAVFTTMTLAWQSANAAWHQRAVQELGADRVLTVEAPNAAAVLHAVRSIDPQGQYAMAVATTARGRFDSRVVAVDLSRYPVVGRVPSGLPAPADLAQRLRPAAVAPPAVTNAPLTLDVTAPPGAAGLRLHLSTAAGQPRIVEFLALAAGRGTAQAEVDGCAPACRLVSLEVLPPAGGPATVEIHELRQASNTVLDGQTLGDITHWRTTAAGSAHPPTLAASEGRLAITVPAYTPLADVPADLRVVPLTAPVPLPVALAGPAPRLDDLAGISALGGSRVPYVVVAEVPALPVVGGRGVLVDLEYVLHSNDDATESADLAVWLTDDAPDSLVAALADHGITVLDDLSVPQRVDQLAGQAPGLALRFGYFAVGVILLLAAGVAIVGSTVDRSGRVAELVALRGQGLPDRALWTAGVAGTALMVGAAALTGVVAALTAEGLVSAALPVFADGWNLLPSAVSAWNPLLVALGVTVVVLGVAALAGAGRLVAAAIRAAEPPAERRRTARDGRHRVDAGRGDRTRVGAS